MRAIAWAITNHTRIVRATTYQKSIVACRIQRRAKRHFLHLCLVAMGMMRVSLVGSIAICLAIVACGNSDVGTNGGAGAGSGGEAGATGKAGTYCFEH